MTQMLLQAENRTDLRPFAQIARKQGIVVRYIVQKEKKLTKVRGNPDFTPFVVSRKY